MIKAACLALLLAGCAAPEPVRDSAFTHLKLVGAVTITSMEDKAGYAACTSTGICEIQIRRDRYPECIEHEMRHAMEGPWHGSRPTTCR